MAKQNNHQFEKVLHPKNQSCLYDSKKTNIDSAALQEQFLYQQILKNCQQGVPQFVLVMNGTNMDNATLENVGHVSYQSSQGNLQAQTVPFISQQSTNSVPEVNPNDAVVGIPVTPQQDDVDYQLMQQYYTILYQNYQAQYLQQQYQCYTSSTDVTEESMESSDSSDEDTSTVTNQSHNITQHSLFQK